MMLIWPSQTVVRTGSSDRLIRARHRDTCLVTVSGA